MLAKSIIVRKTFFNKTRKTIESIRIFESQLPLFVASMCGPAGELEYRETCLF
jgi:hypothetical protein